MSFKLSLRKLAIISKPIYSNEAIMAFLDKHVMNAAKEAFAVFSEEAGLDSRQIYFVNQIVEYIVYNGILKDFSVLQEPPFTD